MKIKFILSKNFGGFEPNDEYQALLNEKGYKWWGELRARIDKDIVEFIEDNVIDNKYGVAQLSKNDWEYVSVVEVDTSLPWTIDDYDGSESIHYIKYEVVDKDLNYCKFL